MRSVNECAASAAAGSREAGGDQASPLQKIVLRTVEQRDYVAVTRRRRNERHRRAVRGGTVAVARWIARQRVGEDKVRNLPAELLAFGVVELPVDPEIDPAGAV